MMVSRFPHTVGFESEPAARISGMAGRATNITARILFFLSGVVSILLAALYRLLRGSDLPNQREWIIFAVVLALVGAVNVLVAIFPALWTARMWGIKDKSSLFSLPLRMFGVFAVVSYLLTVGLFVTPHEWNLSGYLWTYLLCPVYIVRETFDPRPMEIFFMMAPMNAAVWGAIGTIVGLWRSLR
jgi:hypothetical protein